MLSSRDATGAVMQRGGQIRRRLRQIYNSPKSLERRSGTCDDVALDGNWVGGTCYDERAKRERRLRHFPPPAPKLARASSSCYSITGLHLFARNNTRACRREEEEKMARFVLTSRIPGSGLWPCVLQCTPCALWLCSFQRRRYAVASTQCAEGAPIGLPSLCFFLLFSCSFPALTLDSKSFAPIFQTARAPDPRRPIEQILPGTLYHSSLV